MSRPNFGIRSKQELLVKKFLADGQKTSAKEKQEAERFLSTFEITSPEDVVNYAKIAAKFDISISSQKVILPFITALENADSKEFSDLMRAFCECGFHRSHHLDRYKDLILRKSFDHIKSESNKANPNISRIVALLIHIKNLGILAACKENYKNVLVKILDHATQKAMEKESQLNDVGFRSLLEIALYSKEVLKIKIPQNLIELSQKRELSKSSEESEIQENVFRKIINYLRKARSQEGWNYGITTVSKGKKFELGSEHLFAEIEGGWGKLSEDGKPIREVDILLTFSDPKDNQKKYFFIEVDGKKFHHQKIDDQDFVDGKTLERNALYGANLLVIDEKDFHHFQTQKSADEYLSKQSKLSDFRRMYEVGFESVLVSQKIEEDEFFSADSGSEEEFFSADEDESPKVEFVSSAAAKAKKEKKKDSDSDDDEILKKFFIIRKKEELELMKNPPGYLTFLLRKENHDLEEVEVFLNKTEEKARQAIISEFLQQFIEEKNQNLELFLLLVSYCDPAQLKLLRLPTNKDDLRAIIVKRALGETSSSRVDIKFDKKSSWRIGDQNRLSGLIKTLNYSDFNSEHFLNILTNCSRWEFEFMLLGESSRKKIEKSSEDIFWYSCQSRNFDLAKLMVEKGFVRKESKEKNELLVSLMNACIVSQDLEMLRYFKEKSFNLSKVEYPENESSPLTDAVMVGNLDVVKYLVEELGYNPLQVFSKGASALSSSAAAGKVEITRFLLNYLLQKKVSLAGNQGAILILYAIKAKSKDILRELNRRGADFNAYENSLAALHRAVGDGDLDLVKFLVEEIKVKVDHPSQNDQMTAFQAACKFGEVEIARYLVSRGAKTSNVASFNSSAILFATYSDNPEMLRYVEKDLEIRVELKYMRDLFVICIDNPEKKCFTNSLKYFLEESDNKVQFKDYFLKVQNLGGVSRPFYFNIFSRKNNFEMVDYILQLREVTTLFFEDESAGNNALRFCVQNPDEFQYLYKKLYREKDGKFKRKDGNIISPNYFENLLGAACYSGKLETVQFLIAAKIEELEESINLEKLIQDAKKLSGQSYEPDIRKKIIRKKMLTNPQVHPFYMAIEGGNSAVVSYVADFAKENGDHSFYVGEVAKKTIQETVRKLLGSRAKTEEEKQENQKILAILYDLQSKDSAMPAAAVKNTDHAGKVAKKLEQGNPAKPRDGK